MVSTTAHQSAPLQAAAILTVPLGRIDRRAIELVVKGDTPLLSGAWRGRGIARYLSLSNTDRPEN